MIVTVQVTSNLHFLITFVGKEVYIYKASRLDITLSLPKI